MTGDRDDVALSEWERRAFAAIEKELGLEDPALPRRFPRRFRSGLAVAVLLVVVGAACAVATFTWSLAAATASLVVMAAGAALAARPAAARVDRLLRKAARRHHPASDRR